MASRYEVTSRNPDSRGYVHITVLDRLTGEYIRTSEHRFVMDVWPGEPVDVHHGNEIKGDNRPENLAVMSAGDHQRMHPERCSAGGKIGGAVVREKCATDPEFRERQAEYGRQSREVWRQMCAEDPALRELSRTWAGNAGRCNKGWGKVPADLVERVYVLSDQGMVPGAIARLFTSEGLPTPRGQSRSWGRTTILKVISERGTR
jgi:hypothetical protein